MHWATKIIAIGVVLICGPVATAQNWPQFRGPRSDGLTGDAVHPTVWSEDQHVAWKTRIDGVGWSQPIVWGDNVFVTTAVAEGQKRPKPGDWTPGDGIGGLSLLIGSVRRPPRQEYQWRVLCLDLATGKVLWDQVAHTGRPTIPVHPNNSYATETPVTDGERVIASFGTIGVYCFDLEGKLLWKKELGSFPTQMDWGTASSPVLLGDNVFLQCDNHEKSFLIAIDKRSGDEVWRADRDEKSNWCTPFVWKTDARTELVLGGGNKMRSYDPATGELLWEMAASGRSSASPVGTSKLLFVNSADRVTGQRGIVAAIRAGARGDISLEGEQTTNDYVQWSANIAGHRVASPLVISDCVYLLEQQAAIIRCLYAQTGKEHYRKRLPGAVGLTASPWANGGKMFCLDQSGQTFVIEPGNEFKVLATNKLDDEMFWASPAIAAGSLLLRGVDHVYCIR